MKKFDPLKALARQQRLAAAAREAVDACLPPFTSVDMGLPFSRSCKTNPIASAAAPDAWPKTDERASAASSVPAAAPSTSAFRPSRGVDAGLPQLTPVDRALPESRTCKTNKTNPIHPEAALVPARSLSTQQLAAARLLARGHKPADVATELRVTRQAVWKWRGLPGFVAELGRLHELLARQPDPSRRELNRVERR